MIIILLRLWGLLYIQIMSISLMISKKYTVTIMKETANNSFHLSAALVGNRNLRAR